MVMGIYFEQTTLEQDTQFIQKKIDLSELKFDDTGIFYDNGYGEKFIYWVPIKDGAISININGKVKAGILTESGRSYIQRRHYSDTLEHL